MKREVLHTSSMRALLTRLAGEGDPADDSDIARIARLALTDPSELGEDDVDRLAEAMAREAVAGRDRLRRET